LFLPAWVIGEASADPIPHGNSKGRTRRQSKRDASYNLPPEKGL